MMTFLKKNDIFRKIKEKNHMSKYSDLKMKTFFLNNAYRTKQLMRCAYPLLVILLLLLLQIRILSGFKWWIPVLGIIPLINFSRHLMQTIKDFTFSVELSGESIRVGNIRRSWEEIKRAEVHTAQENEAVVVLYTTQNECLCIPAVIDGLVHIEEILTHNVEDISKT